MRLTLTKTINGAIQESVFEIPDKNLMSVIELLEADADAQAGRTRSEGIAARVESNRRADEVIAEWKKRGKK